MLSNFLAALRRHGLIDPQAWFGRLVVWLAAVAVGLAVVAFAELSARAYDFIAQLHARSPWLLLLTPVSGILILWLTRRFFPGAQGGGIPEVIAARSDAVATADLDRFVSLRIAAGKFGLVLAAVAGGFSAGREGPSVHIGACLMHACRPLLPRSFAIDVRGLLVAGGAAGMAAAFNTPLAGIVFAIEQLAGRFEQGTNGVLIAAIVWAGLVSLAVLGNYTYFGRLHAGELALTALPALVGVGIVCGLAGGLFARLLLAGVDALPWLARLRALHPYAFVALCGVLVAALSVATGGATLGGGYETTRDMLAGAANPAWYDCIARFAATLLTALSGIPAGIFAPSLAVGAGIGADLAAWFPSAIGLGAMTALCMAAYLAAVTHAPLTAFVVVMEMVDGHAMVLSLMVVSMIASLVARLISPPLFETLAARLVAAAGRTEAVPQGEDAQPRGDRPS